MTYTPDDLATMTAEQLDELFRHLAPGEIPNGEANGTALIAEGTPLSPALAQIINIFAWQGKTFDASSGMLVNRITFFGISAIVAKVYSGKSWLDGNDCIVLDYSETSTVAHWVRDEIRILESGLYLGVVFWDQQRIIHFALQFGNSSH
jgi:hypothetical protein